MDKAEATALARRFIALPGAKRRVFWESLQEDGIDFALFPIPGGVATGELRPASYGQRRLWLLWQLDPLTSAYHIACSQRLSGPLDIGALEQAFIDLARRHETLRTTFEETDGALAQRVHAHAQPGFERHDLSALAPEEAERRALALTQAATHAPFDLAAGPLLRASLFRLAADEHVLLLVMHHIVSDAWSLRVLVDEVGQLYEARRQGVAAILPDLPIQYADYALWQRAWLEAGEGERQLAWWTARLGHADTVLELPTDRLRPAVWSYRGASVSFAVPDALTAGLRALAQTHRSTPFMLLLAAFKLLLFRWSGQADLRVGIPVANRQRAETERLIGFFVNTQVLRTEVDGRAGFTALLEQVREAALGAQGHQDLPFEQLVLALRPERSLGHNPLFQVMFNHTEGAGPGVRRIAGLMIEDITPAPATTQFDLTLDTVLEGGRLSCSFTYATDLFEAATIERLGRWLVTLLGGIVAAPERAVDELPLVDEAERRQLVTGWNSTETAYDTSTGLLARLRQQAEETPDAVALVAGEERLSYRLLHARADRLAGWLVAQGVGPDSLAGIAALRSVEMVVGLLGVLKAGAAYVPLDPELPPERLAYMVRQSGMRLLLAQEQLVPGLPELPVPVHPLEQDWSEARGGPPPELHPLSLAYCIFTSGSTGRPKGVGNSHAGLLNRLLWMQAQYGLGPADRVLQKTPFGFDVSVWEFLWPLLAGATLVMAPPGAHRDPAALRTLIVAEGVTTLHFVPSMLQAFIAAGELEACTSLRRVVCSGEALPLDLRRQFLARHGAGLHNLYGPTEAAIDVTAWDCREEGGRRSRSAARSPTPRCTSWTATWSRCRWGCWASCTWAG
jgi:non-ribosomal peptide synthetase component F